MRVITAASAAAFLASQAFSHPTSATPRRSLLGRVVDLNAFRLDTVADYSNSTSTAKTITTSALFKREDYVDAATALVKKVAPGKEFRLVDDHYIGTNGIAHVNFKQTVHQLDIDNADFNVNVSPTYQLIEISILTVKHQDRQRWQRIFLWKLFLFWNDPF